MTLQQIESDTREILIPADIAPILECDPHDIRVAAHQKPELLGFPVVLIGNRVKIPRLAFLKFMKGEQQENAG